MDDIIAQFTDITSASPERAAQYLRLTDGDLAQAMQLFFDSDGVDLEGLEGPATSTPTTTSEPPAASPLPPQQHDSRIYADESGVVHIDSDEEMDDDNDEPQIVGSRSRGMPPDVREVGPTSLTPVAGAPPPRYSGGGMEDDESMARRLQEEMYAGVDIGSGLNADGVRAPMGRTTETLVGSNGDWGNDSDDMRAAIAQQMMARQRGNRGRAGIFNQRATSASVWDDTNADPSSRRQNLAQATAGASEASSKSSLLAEMYRPPFEIMCRLPWDDARQEGKDGEKWILVNVQDPAVFDCQVLNRDIWKNDQIKETIKENFLFMQYVKDDPRGNQYIQYYFQARDSQAAYPHIAIVDPRTGEQVKVWSGPPSPKPIDFLMQLHEFLDRYSLKVNAKNPVATRKQEKKKDLDVNRMTEEEMLQMAMQNSMDNNGGPREDDPDALTRSTGDVSKGKGRAEEGADEVLDEAVITDQYRSTNGGLTFPIASPFSLISSKSPHNEPPPDPSSTTRIQVRHAGGRIIRRFLLTDPVRRLYEWLKASPLEGKEGVEFELISLGKNLVESLEDTIEQAGLKNGTVMVEFLED
ncbi:MAG: hypothetical protein M1827_000781 [Pycnora praestabilis]|nr:MAG: hypothetical protein M1827_000781 [Pycnora praestabilis]